MSLIYTYPLLYPNLFMLLQLVVSLVTFVDLEHHRVEFTVEGLVCGIVILINE